MALHNDSTPVMLIVHNLSKSFTLHAQGGVRLPVFHNLNLCVRQGECVALHGPSGAGKSTLLRSLYANYKPCGGSIRIRHSTTDAPSRGMENYSEVDITTASPRTIMSVRRHTVGYVSQFLRVIPRVSSMSIVAEPLMEIGMPREEAEETAAGMLQRLRIPERLWRLAPATFSGGEQQRVNIARGLIRHYPILLLDEPTASLDAVNRQSVVELIQEKKAGGCAVVGIFHDAAVREAVADRCLTMTPPDSQKE